MARSGIVLNEGKLEGAGGMVALCQVKDIPKDAGLRVEWAYGPPIAVFLLSDGVYVVDDTCTHGEASLCDGEIMDDEIVCPFHAGTFNLKTGEATAAPCTLPLKTHCCEVREGVVYAQKPI